MKRIRDNYDSIKEKADNFMKENDFYRNEIKKFEEKNEELKNEIMKLKHENIKMNIKLMGNKQKKLEENDEENKIWEDGDNKDTNNLINEGIYDYNINNGEFDKIKKEMKNKLEKEEVQKFNKRFRKIIPEIKGQVSFDKMKKRKSLFKKSESNIAYFPSYEYTLPHTPSYIFKYIKNKENYKKYINGKIIRGYTFDSENYYVMKLRNKNKSI